MARKTGSPGMDSPFSALFVCSIQPTGRKTGKGNIMGESNSNTNQNQNDNPTSGQGTGEKTFTQEDVNRIVQERLAKEKARNGGEADFTKREQELARRELHMTARELLSEKGLPVQLFDALNCTDKEALEKSIATVEKVFNEYKANAASIKLTGFQPGGAGIMTDAQAAADL